MAVGFALLVSADPVAIQQFSHALQELSIAPDISREVLAARRLIEPPKVRGRHRRSPTGRTVRHDLGRSTSFLIEQDSGYLWHQRL